LKQFSDVTTLVSISGFSGGNRCKIQVRAEIKRQKGKVGKSESSSCWELRCSMQLNDIFLCACLEITFLCIIQLTPDF